VNAKSPDPLVKAVRQVMQVREDIAFEEESAAIWIFSNSATDRRE
jgi:hypothetical protein